MKHKVKERTEQNATPDQCHHYWVIEAADGPTSLGECRYCGETREFLNAFPEFNPMKRNGNPLTLPEIPGVDISKDSKS